MDANGFNEGFDILFNNITSNQAPGLNVHEKSLFLTKAEYEIVKNRFNPSSKGNTTGQGFDDTAIRQADFSSLMRTALAPDYVPGTQIISGDTYIKSHNKGKLFKWPQGIFISINETLRVTYNGKVEDLQVIPLKYDKFTALMSKPFKRPVKGQAWRIIAEGTLDSQDRSKVNNIVELVAAPEYDNLTSTEDIQYIIRYIRKPAPIIVGELDDLNIDGWTFGDYDPLQKTISGCELDESIHHDILQRAVELAKVAWTSTGQDNAQMMIQAGTRSE